MRKQRNLEDLKLKNKKPKDLKKHRETRVKGKDNKKQEKVLNKRSSKGSHKGSNKKLDKEIDKKLSINNDSYLNSIFNKKITRKQFLELLGFGLASLGALKYFNNMKNKVLNNNIKSASNKPNFNEAMFYEKLPNKQVRCLLCPHMCILNNNEYGFCRARKNINGVLYSMVYGKVVSFHIDPVEKKPLYHFYPGTKAYSIATAGCNFRCLNCQNWEISQFSPDDIPFVKKTPEIINNEAKKNNTKSIAYTYNEPLIFYEFMLDTAKLARKNNIKNLLISNGYINEKPLKLLAKYIDAANIDLKSFNDKTYHKLNAGDLDTVLSNLKLLKRNNVWLEITNLVIPKWTDNLNEIREMSKWIYKNLGRDQVLHFSRFYPMYRLNKLPITPKEVLLKAYKIAKDEGLDYVYIGNAPECNKSDTICPKCGKTLIKRIGYSVIENNIVNNKCRFCGYEIKGVF